MSNHHGFIQELKARYRIIPLFIDDGFIPFIPEFDTGIDLIIYREVDDILIKIQLKSRWLIDRKYIGRGLAMAFPGDADGNWYLIPHDEMVRYAETSTSYLTSSSWLENGVYHRAGMSRDMMEKFRDFKLGESVLNNRIYTYYKGLRGT